MLHNSGFPASKQMQDYLYYSLFIVLALIHSIFNNILQCPSAFLTRIITDQHVPAQNKPTLFHFMTIVSQAPATHLCQESDSMFFIMSTLIPAGCHEVPPKPHLHAALGSSASSQVMCPLTISATFQWDSTEQNWMQWFRCGLLSAE